MKLWVKIRKASKLSKVGEKTAIEEFGVLSKIKVLEAGRSARSVELTVEEKISQIPSFTFFKTYYLCCECWWKRYREWRKNQYLKIVKKLRKEERAEVIALSAKIEEELTALPEEERQLFKELGIKQSWTGKINHC